MINLPINEKDLEKIIATLKKSYPDLYAKLWCYQMNYLNKNTEKS